ncbi:MAG: hypothetical protein R3A79_00145 [Nannocystaceae bacterium]
MPPRPLQRTSLCSALALSLAAGPTAARAADEDAADAASPGASEAASEPPSSTPPPDDGVGDVTIETEEPETQAAMGTSVISSTNPEARRARADLEGTTLLDNTSEDVPERLPPLQRAAWWTMFGTFALATTGGVFAGLAEVQEDRAQRLATTIDIEAGGAFDYADKQAEYEDLLKKGERQAWIARGFLIGAGITLVAGVSLFAVDAKRRGKSKARARLRPAAGGLEVRF